MLRAKRRRTRMHDSKGNPIFNTNNATSKQNNYVMKNNYLESLKTKGNDHNKCKKYYSDKEIIEKHQTNLKDSALIINFSHFEFTWRDDYTCHSGGLIALYDFADDLSGRYKFLGNYTYYNDSPVDCKVDTGNNTFKSVVFLFYVPLFGPTIGFWGIMGFPYDGTAQTFEEAVQYYYENIIIKYGVKYSDFQDCSTLSHPIGSNDITKYYQSTWNEMLDTSTRIYVSMTPDTKHSSADKIKHDMTFRYCKTSIEQNPILGYRKQLVTKHSNQNTKAIQLSLNLTDKSIIDILKQVGSDYFNQIINFSGDYELVNHIEKETNLKDLKFNLAYKKINTKNNNNYEIGYFYEKTPIGNFSFNGWVLRYYNNIANPNIIIDYFYFVDDNDTNRLFVNALDNFSRTTFVIRTKNNDDGIGNKGIFCFIDPNSCNIINNNDNITLKDNDTGDEWYGIVYDKRINPYNNALQFYVGNLTTTSQKTFPYSNTDITINGNTCSNISVDKLVVDIGNIPKSDFIFNKTGHVYFCGDSIVKDQPLNTIYKDNYAKTCGRFRKEDSSLGKFCAYNNVILTKQNNNGIVDANYNYSTSQYLSRPNFMKCNNVYKKSNPRFSTQGAVSGGSRLNRLKYQTILKSQQKYNTLGNTLFQFKLKVGYWEPTSELKLYGYGDGNGITTIPGSLEPDNFKGNEIPTLNITENSFEKTYGLQIYFNKKIEEQISENMLNNFKIILNYNDVNIEFKYSDLTQYYNYRVQFEYDFDDDNTHPNYNLIKNIIGNGEIIGKTVNVIFVFNKLTSENILTIKKLLNNKNVTNMVNGVYPTNLYRNTRPIYKQIYSKNIKCKGRSCNGLLQFCPN